MINGVVLEVSAKPQKPNTNTTTETQQPNSTTTTETQQPTPTTITQPQQPNTTTTTDTPQPIPPTITEPQLPSPTTPTAIEPVPNTNTNQYLNMTTDDENYNLINGDNTNYLSGYAFKDWVPLADGWMIIGHK
jgi:hypothetical protein